MNAMIPSKDTTAFTGTGEGVCLYMKCGLGDRIHALPIIAELVKQEKVTIIGGPTIEDFWLLVQESIPIELLPQTLMMQAGLADLEWIEEAKKKYAHVHFMASYSTWETPPVRDTMDAFAEAVRGVVPEVFSFHDILKPERIFDTSYILFAPESTEKYRSLSHEKAQEVFQSLQREYGKVIWLSKFNSTVDPEEFTLLCDTIDDNDKLRTAWMQLQAEADATERIRMVGKTDCQTFAELRDIVYNADYIITSESGISNLAGALGKDMTILCSVTDPLHIVGQYKRFHSLEYTVVRGESKCSAPCWRKSEHGFLHKGCDCINAIAAEQILIHILQ